MENIRFIGITGGVGSGKSRILEYIAAHYKCEIYLADYVAHQLKEPGEACYQELVALLGKGILQEDGRIDKKAMASRIFSDDALLSRVNAIVHPRVREFLLDKYALAKKNPSVELFFVEAALLIEAGYRQVVHELWYIYADEEVRRKRLLDSRGYSPEKIEDIMRKQLSEERFRRECDFVVDNSKTLEDAYGQIDKKLEAFTWQE